MTTRILLIEDNPGDAVIFREKLNASDLDYELVHTTRLQEGLDLLARDSFDILLCDLSLPDAQGLEAVVKVRRAAPDRPLIVLTGLDDATTAAQAKSEGAVDYLVKWYVDSVSLARYIRYAIAQYQIGGDAAVPAPAPPQPPPIEGQVIAAPPPQRPASPSESPRATDAPPPEALSAALDGAADGVAVVGEGGRVLYANRQARAWIGAGDRYPWPAEAGVRQVRQNGRTLDQRAAPASWGGAEAVVVTLRPAPAPPTPAGAAAAPLLQAVEAALAFVEHTGRQTKWVGEVLRCALDIERRAADGHTAREELLDLAEVVQQVGRDLRPAALERALPLRIQAGRKKVVAFADRVLVTSAVRRLVADAVHVAHPAAGVEVRVDVEGEVTNVEVVWGTRGSDPYGTTAVVEELAGAVADAMARELGGLLQRREGPDRTVYLLTLRGREDVRL